MVKGSWEEEGREALSGSRLPSESQREHSAVQMHQAPPLAHVTISGAQRAQEPTQAGNGFGEGEEEKGGI